jgi:hypothetical protein
VPWFRRLVADLSPRWPGFDPGRVHVGFVWTKWHWDTFPPPPQYFGFPLSISFRRCSITRKNEQKHLITTLIFITGLHNKPHGCGASVASAVGPFTTNKKNIIGNERRYMENPRNNGKVERKRMLMRYLEHGLGKLKPKIDNPRGNAWKKLRFDLGCQRYCSSINLYRGCRSIGIYIAGQEIH